jgi:hypothetical protein
LAGNPLPPDEFEYIELKNISTNTLLDLNGVRLVTGTQFSWFRATFSGWSEL